LKIFEQTLTDFFSADIDRKIFFTITIAIEILIRINQTLIFF